MDVAGTIEYVCEMLNRHQHRCCTDWGAENTAGGLGILSMTPGRPVFTLWEALCIVQGYEREERREWERQNAADRQEQAR